MLARGRPILRALPLGGRAPAAAVASRRLSSAGYSRLERRQTQRREAAASSAARQSAVRQPVSPTFLHEEYPEGMMMETDGSGNAVEQTASDLLPAHMPRAQDDELREVILSGAAMASADKLAAADREHQKNGTGRYEVLAEADKEERRQKNEKARKEKVEAASLEVSQMGVPIRAGQGQTHVFSEEQVRRVQAGHGFTATRQLVNHLTDLRQEGMAELLEAKQRTEGPGVVLQGVPQTVRADVQVTFVPWINKGTGAGAGWFAWTPLNAESNWDKDGFMMFDDADHYSDCDAVKEFAALANGDGAAPIGDIGKMEGGERFETAFKDKAAGLIRKDDATLGSDCILVPTQPMFRKASGVGSSGRYLPHADFQDDLSPYELVSPWWNKSWGKYILQDEGVRATLAAAGSIADDGAEPDLSLFTVDLFSQHFEVTGIQTVWVALNDTATENNQLALCSRSTLSDNERTMYQIFEPGITALGIHASNKQEWFAPQSLKFGQGVRWDATTGAHVAVDREEFRDSAPRLSVECRVLIVEEKK